MQRSALHLQFSAHLLEVLFLFLCLQQAALSPLAAAADDVEVEAEELIIDDGFEIAVSNFDQWVFGAQTSQRGMQRVESQLALQLEAVNQICGLTESQSMKLNLAGRGDLKRFLDDVEVVRQKFMKVRRNRNAFNKIWQDIQPLQTQINSGLFGESSLFHKVLRRTLTAEQSSRYEEVMWERRQFRYKAKLRLVVAMMERSMPLRAQQREQLVNVLLKETTAPAAFSQNDYYVMLYQMSQIPDENLKPIFDDAQWVVFKKFAEQGAGMEAWLKQQKVLP